MDNYTLFIKKSVKEAFYKTGVGFSEACTFLNSVEYGLVKDSSGNKYFTKEELINAKHFRSLDSLRRDNTSTSIAAVFKTTDRELSEVDSDNTEPSTECDNQRDKQS
jgi:hypothetical protein